MVAVSSFKDNSGVCRRWADRHPAWLSQVEPDATHLHPSRNCRLVDAKDTHPRFIISMSNKTNDGVCHLLYEQNDTANQALVGISTT